uniref:Uncharacterized protein n=1 Tax=Tanacetum cinerariifolium TaxID=118510 RepID=A0A6L2JZA5_TANCI|nr:hypothetical protein [Tanacetum cinerariifolium]
MVFLKFILDSDISEHPPLSSESMNEKRNKRRSKEFWFRIQLFKNDFASSLDLCQDPIDMTKVVKAEQEMQKPVYYNFHPLMYDSNYDCSISGLVWDLETWNDNDDLLQQVDPYDWQQDPYHRDDEAEENTELFTELDNLLKRFLFLNDKLKENVVGVNAPVVDVEEQLEMIERVVDEEIETPRKRKRKNEDESASANVLPFRKIKQEEKVKFSLEGREGNEILWFLSASNVVVECFKLLKELQDDELEKSREMMLQSCYL